MLQVKNYEFWLVAGSQFLYGEEQLANVARNAQDVVDKLNASGKLPYKVVCKGVMTTPDGITQFMKDVNYHDEVAGVITWMHTFSPAKNWIRGTVLLQKPLLHLATQYLNEIPYATIDFDYMNLNQSAHGDREYGYLNARLGIDNKIVYGWWGDADVQKEIADWQDVAVAYNESFHIRACRFGDALLRGLRIKLAQAFVNLGIFAVKIVNFADFIVVQVVCGVGVKKRREVIQRLLRRADIFKRAHDVVAQNAEKPGKARVFKLARARFRTFYLIKFKL